MSLRRLDYLDLAFKTMGLSLGRQEADEMSRLARRLEPIARWARAAGPGKTVAWLTDLDRRPLSGRDAQVLLAMAETAVTMVFGLPPITQASRILDVPGLGRTAVRIILQNPALGHVLRMEASGLGKVDSYLLCEVNAARPESIMPLGWASRQDVLGSPKVRLADGEPEAYAVSIAGSQLPLRPLEPGTPRLPNA
jgi:hypothetical protein